MILILDPQTDTESPQFRGLIDRLERLEGINHRVHRVRGEEQVLTEIYLIGNTSALNADEMRQLPCVDRVVRISEPYRVLGRHKDDHTNQRLSLQRRDLRPGQPPRVRRSVRRGQPANMWKP